MSDVASDVMAIIAKKQRAAKPAIHASDRLEDLGLQSLDGVELIFDIEEKFDIQIPYNANTSSLGTAFETVGDVVKAVENLVAQKQS